MNETIKIIAYTGAGLVLSLVVVVWVTIGGNKEMAEHEALMNSMTECERIEYDLNNSRTTTQKRNALLAQQNAYMIGKCI